MCYWHSLQSPPVYGRRKILVNCLSAGDLITAPLPKHIPEVLAALSTGLFGFCFVFSLCTSIYAPTKSRDLLTIHLLALTKTGSLGKVGGEGWQGLWVFFGLSQACVQAGFLWVTSTDSLDILRGSERCSWLFAPCPLLHPSF